MMDLTLPPPPALPEGVHPQEEGLWTETASLHKGLMIDQS